MSETFEKQWEAIVNGEEMFDHVNGGLTAEYAARISAEENADQTPGVEPYSKEWYRMVLTVREELLER